MGLPLDAYRNLWTTLVHYHRLIAVTPAVMGAAAGSIAPLMANVTFGGPDLKTVYLGSLRGRPPTARRSARSRSWARRCPRSSIASI
jgi:sugar lactone lactonase YvrE